MISNFKMIELKKIKAIYNRYNRYSECDENFHCCSTKTDVMCEKWNLLTPRILKVFAHSNSDFAEADFGVTHWMPEYWHWDDCFQHTHKTTRMHSSFGLAERAERAAAWTITSAFIAKENPVRWTKTSTSSMNALYQASHSTNRKVRDETCE